MEALVKKQVILSELMQRAIINHKKKGRNPTKDLIEFHFEGLEKQWKNCHEGGFEFELL